MRGWRVGVERGKWSRRVTKEGFLRGSFGLLQVWADDFLPRALGVNGEIHIVSILLSNIYTANPFLDTYARSY